MLIWAAHYSTAFMTMYGSPADFPMHTADVLCLCCFAPLQIRETMLSDSVSRFRDFLLQEQSELKQRQVARLKAVVLSKAEALNSVRADLVVNDAGRSKAQVHGRDAVV